MSLTQRASRTATSAVKNSISGLQDVATDMLLQELESRLGGVMFGNGIRLQGSGLRLSNQQYGKGIMLGNSIMGRNGTVMGHSGLYESHYNHHPQQRYNI